MEKKLSKAAIDYYKNVGEFKVTADDFDQVKDANKIMNMAVGDILAMKKRRTRNNFDSDAEYNLYLAAIYEQARRAELGFPVGPYTDND